VGPRDSGLRPRLALTIALLALAPRDAFAEWHFKPFVGLTFGGGTTLSIDLEEAVGGANAVAGGSVMLLGDMLGVEADFGWAPGFFQRDQGRVVRSGVTTLTGNVVVTLPRRMTQYTLRPYVAGGFGLMRVRGDDDFGLFLTTAHLPTIDVGGGVTGFVTNRLGVSWDVRYFRNIAGTVAPGLALGAPRLSFWRANMALAVRY